MRKRPPPLFTSKGDWFALSVYSEEGGLGVAIPRALYPHSTSRNRLRRQIREAIRTLPKEEAPPFRKIPQGYRLLIRIQKKGKVSFAMIQKEMRAHLKKWESAR